MEKIVPELPKGFRDFLPKEMISRQDMMDTIRGVFERFGFVPIETPAIEKEEVLTGGDPNFKKEIIYTDIEMGEGRVALHFDLTVPLARFVSEHQNEIKKPFKRYQIAKVWRGEKPQAGRLREFLQCDADIIGSSSSLADAEAIALIYEILSSLGVERFLIRVNNRKILSALYEYANFPEEKTGEILRAVDKMEKQGWEEVEKELIESGLSGESLEKIREFVRIDTGSKEGDISEVEKLLGGISPAQEGIEELKEIREHLSSLGIPEEVWTFDISVIRGLGYYTGPVFETTLLDMPEIGSVSGGGRYNGLVDRFSNIPVPATGVSIGVDRLIAALEKMGKFGKKSHIAKVMVLNFDSEAKGYVQEIATMVRKSGIPTETYLGGEEMLSGQLSFALNAEIPVVIIAGSDEKKKKTVQVKNVETHENEEVGMSDLVKRIQKILSSTDS